MTDTHMYWTWNAIITPIVVLLLGIYINRLLSRGDSASVERHKTIQNQFAQAAQKFEDFDKKLTAFCSGNEKAHDEVWKFINTHGHRGLKGEDNQVTYHT